VREARMPIYKCPKCGRLAVLPEGTYYCKRCGPSTIMQKVKVTLGKRGRYWVFCAGYYYPSGGFGDFEGATDNLEEAKAYCLNYVKEEPYTFCHIVDTSAMKIIERFSSEELEYEAEERKKSSPEKWRKAFGVK